MCEHIVIDCETDGFNPTVIFCLGIYSMDTQRYDCYVGDDVVSGLMRVASAKMVVGHNIRGFDIPVIERLTEGLVEIPESKVVDTLDLSRTLYPSLANHKLSIWGEIFNYPKLEWKKFDRFYPEMLPYMERDVMLNVRIFEYFMESLYAA